MANIQINIVENGTTTLATSGCICDRNIDINVDVPTTGGGSGSGDCDGLHIPESALILTGNQNYSFYFGHWDWFINTFGDKITTENLSSTDMMFNGCNVEKIPFALNFNSSEQFINCGNMFKNMKNVKEIGDVVDLHPNNIDELFYNCYNLRYLPNFVRLDLSYAQSNKKAMDGLFKNCYSLRQIPESLLKELYSNSTTSYNVIFYDGFGHCRALDEIIGLSPLTSRITSNAFSSTFNYCTRLKDIIFDTQEDGTPYTAEWKNQDIDLTNYVGYFPNLRQTSMYLGDSYNSGISLDKVVNDDASYQALKNDPDWFTYAELEDANYAPYCRYNHDSAVRTIQSLPDTSAYLATQTNGTNIINFNGKSGGLTDGGAIETLTVDEVAIANAKGWTVKLNGKDFAGV